MEIELRVAVAADVLERVVGPHEIDIDTLGYLETDH